MPPVTVLDLPSAIAALRGWGDASRPVLISAEAAALFAGCLWWRRLIDLAVAETGIGCDDWLDCADAPGQAMAALRVGCRGLIMTPDLPSLPALYAIAAPLGARIVLGRDRIPMADAPGSDFPTGARAG